MTTRLRTPGPKPPTPAAHTAPAPRAAGAPHTLKGPLMDDTKRGIDAPIQCHKCGDTVGPFDLYDGHLHCEDCLPGGDQ